MRRKGRLRKKWLCMLLALLLGTGLAFTGYVPEVKAAGSVTEMANLVVFVKMQGDGGNVFDEIVDNISYKTDNWKQIKGMFQGGTDPQINNSFANYIQLVTCNKVTVRNIFPQIYMRDDGTEGIHVLEMSLTQYDTPDAMAREVIEKIQESSSGNNLHYLDVSGFDLDLNRDGCVDNLTIIVQGNNINGEDHSFKTDYGGSEKINNLDVRCYNAMPSSGVLGLGGARLISHEFLHTLGLPDLYRQDVVPGQEGGPVGIWDVMAGSTSTTPQYPLGYLRAREGWLEGDQVGEITKSGTYTLTAVCQPDGSGGTRLFTIRTPMPQGDSEIICLEYRKALPTPNFEHFPAGCGGLLMYRVDNKVEEKSNFFGKNYIYVYRSGISAPNDCAPMVTYAPLQEGQTYGSTDLNTSWTENTLYYSDGSNSGIRISNLQFVPDTNETQITFQVEFAEYGDEWQALGGVAASDVRNKGANLYADSAGNLYLGYINTSKQLCVRRWDQAAGAWQQLGGTIPSHESSIMAMSDCNGQLYLAYVDAAGNPAYSVWNGSSWSNAVQIDSGYPNSMQLLTDGSEIYAVYQSPRGDQQQLVIRNLGSGAVVADGRTAGTDKGGFSNPTAAKQGDLFYVAYGIYPDVSKIDAYDPVTKTWSTVFNYDTWGNINLLHRQGTKLYGLSGRGTIPGEPGVVPVLAMWDGSTWVRTAVPQMSQYHQVSLLTAGETVYLAYKDNINKKAGLLRLSGDSFVPCYEGLNGQADDFQAVVVGDQVFVATTTGNSVTVRCQRVEYVPEPIPPQLPPLTISLTPPAGYDNADVYIDGVRYTAEKSGDSYTLQLPDKTGRTAVMYYYNERNVPKGMYVWRLGYQGDTCTATPLPGLQDLLSYHGFSIRVQGYSGLRFKSGIDTRKRAQLLGGGVDGYHLTEYGTLLITGSNMQKYPFIKDGEKVGGGRSYWTENGVVNDRIFETVDGRYRFASVVTKLPQQQYATELAFRSYAILQGADGDQLIIYGPPVARSIYTVAKQVLAAGEFKPGSSGYNYVKGIVDVVEGQ